MLSSGARLVRGIKVCLRKGVALFAVDRYCLDLMEGATSRLVGEGHIRVTGYVEHAAVVAELRVVGGSLCITDLRMTLDGGFLPRSTEGSPRPNAITSDTVRSVSFERIHEEARDLLLRRLPRLPDDATFTAEELADAAESRMPKEWREARKAARELLLEDRSRRGRPTDIEGLTWLARRYFELDHDPARPALRRTLAEEASAREGADVSEATIGKRLRRATELLLIEGREASRRGGSRLGPGYFAHISQEGTT